MSMAALKIKALYQFCSFWARVCLLRQYKGRPGLFLQKILDVVQRTDDVQQVFIGYMQIPQRGFYIIVTQQTLYKNHISSFFY